MSEFEGVGQDIFAEKQVLGKETQVESLPNVELETVQRRLEEWQKLKKTPMGEILDIVAIPRMRDAAAIALASASYLLQLGYPAELHEIVRAEARGVYQTWEVIKYLPEKLVARQAELEKAK